MVDWEAEKYLSQAEKKGGLRMPADILFFHLTRLNHMATSCVGCGLCQESCPMNIPIFSIFRLVGSEVQKGFDYVPGKSLEDELPITTYKEEEFDEWGKEGFISPGITTKGMSGVTQI
jgi:formate dehydrogenase subunit beta